MSAQNGKDKPLEYWISRATDPYADNETRKTNVEIMCDRVKELSVKLLYSWQRSMRHVEKFKEVGAHLIFILSLNINSNL
uniref:DDE Tnp4 domain-containing protein n=1 Tax=Heterorhabditis bacteriophora TaxID=37862 RepID=A0A1I7WX91_HETBA